MKKGMVIAGFAGIGKTMLAQKYSNVIDLESSPYKWLYKAKTREELEAIKGTANRTLNPDFPNNYIKVIKEAQKNYDLVMIWIDPEQCLCECDKNGIDYTLCFPSKESFKNYEERYKNRGNNPEWIQKVTDYFYNKAYNQFKNLGKPYIELKDNQTLEDYLKKQDFSLEIKYSENSL